MDEVAVHPEATSLELKSLTTLADGEPASPRPISVLHVHSGNLFGGIERAILTCVENLHLAPSIRFEFALCFTGKFSEELAAAGQTIHKLPEVRTRNPLSIVAARRNLARLLKQKQYDVVLCHSAVVTCDFCFGYSARRNSRTLLGPRPFHWQTLAGTMVSQIEARVCDQQ